MTPQENCCRVCESRRADDMERDGADFATVLYVRDGCGRPMLCADCGNKRCPKATDHNNECTGSNEPGQKGSVYA